ncbi:MAG TPA: hypothetical protein VIJ93_06220 [bacterium]
MSPSLSDSNSQPTPLHSQVVPKPFELFETFNLFLIKWANLAAQFVTAPMEDMASLPVEQGLLFYEPYQGFMVVRSTKAYEKYLVELWTGKKSTKDSQKHGLFMEMAVLFWHLLVLKLWRLDSRTLKPAILKETVPLDWPDRKPDSICMVFIKEFPLEIRFWAHLSEDEMKGWKKHPLPAKA